MENNKEMVNHPDHYKNAKYECIDVMLDNFGAEATMQFCLLNAFKYLWRLGKKDDNSQEVRKAMWYLNEYLKISESIKEGEIL